MTVHLDDRIIMGEGVKVIVEDRLADDVQRKPREKVLHLYALPGLHSPRPSARQPHVLAATVYLMLRLLQLQLSLPARAHLKRDSYN